MCSQRTPIKSNIITRNAEPAFYGSGLLADSLKDQRVTSNAKSPVVTCVSTDTTYQTTLYLPGFSSGSETVSKASFD
jgi:hypothetical protein